MPLETDSLRTHNKVVLFFLPFILCFSIVKICFLLTDILANELAEARRRAHAAFLESQQQDSGTDSSTVVGAISQEPQQKNPTQEFHEWLAHHRAQGGTERQRYKQQQEAEKIAKKAAEKAAADERKRNEQRVRNQATPSIPVTIQPPLQTTPPTQQRQQMEGLQGRPASPTAAARPTSPAVDQMAARPTPVHFQTARNPGQFSFNAPSQPLVPLTQAQLIARMRQKIAAARPDREHIERLPHVLNIVYDDEDVIRNNRRDFRGVFQAAHNATNTLNVHVRSLSTDGMREIHNTGKNLEIMNDVMVAFRAVVDVIRSVSPLLFEHIDFEIFYRFLRQIAEAEAGSAPGPQAPPVPAASQAAPSALAVAVAPLVNAAASLAYQRPSHGGFDAVSINGTQQPSRVDQPSTAQLQLQQEIERLRLEVERLRFGQTVEMRDALDTRNLLTDIWFMLDNATFDPENPLPVMGIEHVRGALAVPGVAEFLQEFGSDKPSDGNNGGSGAGRGRGRGRGGGNGGRGGGASGGGSSGAVGGTGR